jgi:hypothetical protein
MSERNRRMNFTNKTKKLSDFLQEECSRFIGKYER